MLADQFGQMTTLNRADALAAWDETTMAFLAHSAATPTHLGRALELVPSFALGHAVKGLFYVLLGRRELLAVAKDALSDAQRGAAAEPVSGREQRYIDALSACLAGRFEQAVAYLEQVLASHPGDALAAKLSHAIRFVLGDADGMRSSLEAVLPAYGEAHVARGYMLGCYAFALEETGDRKSVV